MTDHVKTDNSDLIPSKWQFGDLKNYTDLHWVQKQTNIVFMLYIIFIFYIYGLERMDYLKNFKKFSMFLSLVCNL